jgi:hypothetical protein
MFSDDGYKITVKLGGEEVFKEDALNRGQHLPNVDGNPSATRSLHLLPIMLEIGVTYEIEVVYRNKLYRGTTDIDGITVFVVDSSTDLSMCSAFCTNKTGLHPTTAVGDHHHVYIGARVDTHGHERTYKVLFKPHTAPNGSVKVNGFEVTAWNGNDSVLLTSHGFFQNYATFTVRAVNPPPNYIATELLTVKMDFEGVNPGSVTLLFYDTRMENSPDNVKNMLRDLPNFPGDERKTWMVGTGEVAAIANAGVAVSGARAYLPRGGGTVEVVVKADLGVGVAHDVIENWPNNPDGDPWPVRVLWQSDAGTVTAVVRGRGTASTIFGANPDFVGQTTLSWVTGTSTNVATLTVVRVEFLDKNQTVIISPNDFANVAKWASAFEDGPPITAKKDFYKTDDDRFYVKISDAARKGAGGAKAKIKATIKTFDIENDEADKVENFELEEDVAGSGKFVSEPFVLVSNKVDDEFDANNVADGNSKDPTLNIFKTAKLTGDPLKIQIGGKVRVEYDPATGQGPAAGAQNVAKGEVNICKPSDIKEVKVRAVILKNMVGGAKVVDESEVKEDIALMNVAWAQCCIKFVLEGAIVIADPPPPEPFQDVGYDHDGNPATPNVGAGNGVFDFIDTNNDGLHNPGEPSEPFTDTNGNGGYDFGVDLTIGGLDGFNPNLTREERSLLDTLSDADPKTIDIFIVNTFSVDRRGEAFLSNDPPRGGKLKVPNALIVRAASVGIDNAGNPRDFVNTAHEAGHVLLNFGAALNFGHTPRNTTAGRVNVMVDGGTDAADGVTNSKRLTETQCTTAKGFGN